MEFSFDFLFYLYIYIKAAIIAGLYILIMKKLDSVYEPAQDKALIKFLSLEDGNSSPEFVDYLPVREKVFQWLDESMDVLGIKSAKTGCK